MKLFQLVLVIGGLILCLAFVSALSQTPTSGFPDHDVAYTCTPTVGNGPLVNFKFSNLPGPHFDVSVGIPPNGIVDTQNPVIVSVTNSAGIDVTTGGVKLLDANHGLPITVTANDNVGVVGGKLEVDGKMATPFGNGIDVLPVSYFIRWNAKTITLGPHTFRLTVCDITQNCAVRTWSMTR